MRTWIRLLSCAAALSVAGASHAQNFNVDFSLIGGADGPAPTDLYGAAAGQTGFWNNRTASTGTTTPLNDLTNGATAVTLTLNAGGAMGSFNGANSAATIAGSDAERLIDDGWDTTSIVGGGVITIAGLAPGTYSIYLYGVAPDSVTAQTGFSVDGGVPAGQVNTGGALGAANTFGDASLFPVNTYAVFTATINAGDNLVIHVLLPVGSPFTTVNGLQIVPTPGSLALLTFGSGLFLRRRR